MDSTKELKVGIPYEIKNIDPNGTIEGYAGAYSLDAYFDRIKPGAWKKTIKEKKGKWLVLKDHDGSKKIGFNIEAREDDNGLWVKEQLNLNVQDGREEYMLAKQAMEVGAQAALSIGFTPVKFKFEEEEGKFGKVLVRIIQELRMWEHSHVAFGANPDAMVHVVKSLQNDKSLGLDKYVDRFFNHMESLGHKQADVLESLNALRKNKGADPEIIQSASRIVGLLKGTI